MQAGVVSLPLLIPDQGLGEIELTVDGSGGVVIRSAHRKTAAVRLLPEHVVVATPESSGEVALAWSAYGDTAARRPRWELCAWTSTRWGDLGLAVAANGEIGTALLPLRKATGTVLQRLIMVFSGRGARGVIVPVVATAASASPDERQRSTVRALCAVLACEPHLRAQLRDEARCRRLASDVTVSWIGSPAPGRGVGRDSVDIDTAIDLLGLAHKHGRPLRRLDPTEADDVISAVTERVDQNPYRADRPRIDRAKVAETVRRRYLDVEPWPFAALL